MDKFEAFEQSFYFDMLCLFQIPEEKKLDLLKTIAASSPYAAAQDSRQLLPSIVQLLKVSTFF